MFRVPLFLAVALLILVPVAPAQAKGPVGASIEGPGFDGVVPGERLQDLTDVTYFSRYAVGDPPPEVDPPAEPGPAYTVSYDVGGPQEFRQVLYPSSSEGSLIFTPPGQQVWQTTVPGGWIEAPVNLTLFLRRYGVDVPAQDPGAPLAPADSQGTRVTRMSFLHDVLTLLHFVGFAALFGGFFVQLKAQAPVVNNAMLHGVLTQLVTGVLLVGLASGVKDDDFTVDNSKVAVKLVITLVITVLVLVNRKKPAIARGLLMGIGGLTLLNAIVAVFWH